MSLSQERPTNPAKLFIKVKNGGLVYYDKEQGENVSVPTPFEFIVLDQLATIKGWSDQDESGYWSNEVRSVGRDTLNVRTSKGLKESGIWRDIKGSVGIAGAKYHSSIYIAAKGKDGLEIFNLALTGAALNSWIEFTQKNNVRTNKVTLSDWADAKKGSVKYKTPVFTATPMGDEEKAEAIELDKQLQEYLAEYFNYTPEVTDAAEKTEAAKDVVVEDIGDEPINLDDIPF
jgi:hypothetical protein